MKGIGDSAEIRRYNARCILAKCAQKMTFPKEAVIMQLQKEWNTDNFEVNLIIEGQCKDDLAKSLVSKNFVIVYV